MLTYEDFLERKRTKDIPSGFDITLPLNPYLKDFQAAIVRWGIKRGRAAIFAGCGLGKTLMQLEWARHIQEKTGQNVLIIAPLAVSRQTVHEGEKFGIPVVRLSEKIPPAPISIINYEQLHKYRPDDWGGVVLDESSILKSIDGKHRTALIEEWSQIPYRLACTATPAPNDYTELGNHSEFLGIMTRVEMLATFFTHDGGNTSQWRLKKHGEDEYWKWVAGWAMWMQKPSDLGFSDEGYELPPLHFHEIRVSGKKTSDTLFPMEAKSLRERQKARGASIAARIQKCAEIVADKPNESWFIWCDLNAESTYIQGLIDGIVEVTGSDTVEKKEAALMGFAHGDIQYLVTKPSIAGFGLNLQTCHNIIFVGLSDSYEKFYQAVRRFWRFGQNCSVNCYIVISETEGAVLRNIKRKEKDMEKMTKNITKAIKQFSIAEITHAIEEKDTYKTDLKKGKNWSLYRGDSVEVVKTFPGESVDYIIFSPPFSSLYVYSNSMRDMGNCRNDSEFFEHFDFLIAELYRVLRPGRLCSFHCMNLPTLKARDGYIGIRNFRDELIRAFERHGFIYASEVVIWKDPVISMQRTKAKGLLHKQLVKDSAHCRQGLPDFLETMKKPGENQMPIAGELDHFEGDQSTFQSGGRFSIDVWQRYASPVWMDINPSDTIQYKAARENNDERHIAPLQLEVIHRALQLWTNSRDIVLSPFAGVGSEGHESIRMNRQFIGVELKESYFNQACLNLEDAEREFQEDLFHRLEKAT